jgi:putative transposase
MYTHIANIHKNNCYNGALQIIRCNPEAIILETLGIKSMMANHFIADDLQCHPLGVAQQIMENQAFKYDIPVYYAPKGFPSSNICSNCGSYKDIKFNKYFRCDCCGLVLDRDINAAINLKNWYIQNKDNL